MTTYILHGGGDGIFNDLIEELSAGCLTKKYLLVYQAKERGDWENAFSKDVSMLTKINISKENILQGSENIEELIQQILLADFVIFKGGSSLLIKKKLLKLKKKMIKLLEGKIVIGISAGAYLLSKFYFSNDRKKIEKGFSVLNIAIFCHYDPSLVSYQNDLMKKTKIPIYLLKERDYVKLVY